MRGLGIIAARWQTRVAALVVLSLGARGLAQTTVPGPTTAPSTAPATAPATQGTTAPALSIDPADLNIQAPPMGQTDDFLPETRGAGAEEAKGKEKSNEWLIAPIPMYNPTIGGGAVVGVGYLFHADQVSPVSTVAGFGGATTNGSWMAGAMTRTYLDEDHYRLTLAFVHADINYDFFGIGNAAAKGFSVPVTQTANGMLTQVLFQTVPHLYLGPRYVLGTMTLESRSGPSLPALYPALRAPFSAQIGALGLVTQWDNTDNQIYPTRGEFFDLTSEFYSDAFGGSVNFERFTFTGEEYLKLADNQVLAFREIAETVAGDAPVYMYPTAGVKGDFRGYRAGRYRDRLLMAGQLEYRYRLTDHWGFAVFGSVGEVASSPRSLSFNDLLPSGGGGIRYRISKAHDINFRLDVAGGKDGAVVYFGVGEAF